MMKTKHLGSCSPIKVMMCGSETTEETNTQETIPPSIQIKMLSSGNSLSNIWPIMTSLLSLNLLTWKLTSRKFITSGTVKDQCKCTLLFPKEILKFKISWANTLLLVQLQLSNMPLHTLLLYWMTVPFLNGTKFEEFMNSCLVLDGLQLMLELPFVLLSQKFVETSWNKLWMQTHPKIIMTDMTFWLVMLQLEHLLWTWNTGNNVLIPENSKLMIMDQQEKIKQFMEQLTPLNGTWIKSDSQWDWLQEIQMNWLIWLMSTICGNLWFLK